MRGRGGVGYWRWDRRARWASACRRRVNITPSRSVRCRCAWRSCRGRSGLPDCSVNLRVTVLPPKNASARVAVFCVRRAGDGVVADVVHLRRAFGGARHCSQASRPGCRERCWRNPVAVSSPAGAGCADRWTRTGCDGSRCADTSGDGVPQQRCRSCAPRRPPLPSSWPALRIPLGDDPSSG